MSNNSMTPPPAPQPPSQQTPEARTGSRALAITVGVVGGVVILGALAFALARPIFASVSGGSSGPQHLTADASGLRAVNIDSSSGDFRLEFGDVDEAVLDATSDAGDWTLTRDGDTLVVDSPNKWFGFSWNVDRDAVLTLPSSLEGLDLDVSIAAGSFETAGTFGEVAYDLSAGEFEIEGSATSLDADMSAGNSAIELSGLLTASFEVSAGDLRGDLTGAGAPDEVDIKVSAGSLELVLPDVPYAVTRDSAFGDINSNLDESSRAPRTIDIDLSAGDVTLKAG